MVENLLIISAVKTYATCKRSEILAKQNKFAGGIAKKEIISNQKLAEKLHKPIMKKFEKSKLYSSFIDNIWGADLANMQLMSKVNKIICFLLCVIDIFSSFKRQKGITVTNVFQKHLFESNRKQKRI